MKWLLFRGFFSLPFSYNTNIKIIYLVTIILAKTYDVFQRLCRETPAFMWKACETHEIQSQEEQQPTVVIAYFKH